MICAIVTHDTFAALRHDLNDKQLILDNRLRQPVSCPLANMYDVLLPPWCVIAFPIAGECDARRTKLPAPRSLIMVSKSESSPRLIAAQSPDWLLQVAQQIQVIDYELHAAIRIIGRGEMRPEHIPAFMNACVERDRLMARVISYLAEQRKQSGYNAVAGRTAKPET